VTVLAVADRAVVGSTMTDAVTMSSYKARNQGIVHRDGVLEPRLRSHLFERIGVWLWLPALKGQ
jgi:hypothetical protein